MKTEFQVPSLSSYKYKFSILVHGTVNTARTSCVVMRPSTEDACVVSVGFVFGILASGCIVRHANSSPHCRCYE